MKVHVIQFEKLYDSLFRVWIPHRLKFDWMWQRESKQNSPSKPKDLVYFRSNLYYTIFESVRLKIKYILIAPLQDLHEQEKNRT